MQFTQFSKIATRQEIDAPNAVVKGVSVISKGEAEGHGFVIDDTTLDQVCSLASKFSDGLKVRFNHPQKGKDAPIQSIAGCLKNFRKEDNKVRADLFLLKSNSDTAKIMEMASVMPEAFGLSVVFSGKDEESGDLKLARCTEIYACDLVDAPAANPTGLFSKPNTENSMFDKFTTQLSKLFGVDPSKATEKEIEAALAATETKLAAKPTNDEEIKRLAAVDESIKTLSAEITALKADKDANVSLAKKAEIDSLISEASKEGKILPLDTADIYTQKDGKTVIHVEPSMLRKMIEKLPKNQVQLTRKQPVKPQGKDEKAFARHSDEWKNFYASERERGAAALTEKFSSIN